MVKHFKKFALTGSILALILAFTVTASASSHPALLSLTHPDEAVHYSNNSPSFSWTYEPGAEVQGYSYSLDQDPAGEPDTSVIENVTDKSYADLADGTWYFHVKGVDIADNWSDTAHYTVNIDTTGPSGTVSINDGAETATENNVTLTLDATDALSGVTEMRYAGTPDGLAAAAYGAYGTSAAVTLSAGNGAKTVYAQFRDAAGNESDVVSDDITLASTAEENLPVLSIGINAKWFQPGDTAVLTGTLVDANGIGMTGQTVSIKSKGKIIGTVVTGDGGAYSYETQPTKNTPYKAVYTDVSGEKINSKAVVAHVKKAKKIKPVKPAKEAKVKKAKKGAEPITEPVETEEPVILGSKAAAIAPVTTTKNTKGGKTKTVNVKASTAKGKGAKK